MGSILFHYVMNSLTKTSHMIASIARSDMFSRREIFFFVSLARICSFFGLVPDFDFQNNILVKEKRYKRRVTVINILLLFLIPIIIWNNFNLRNSALIIDVIGITQKVCVYLSIWLATINSYNKRATWQLLFRKFATIDNILANERTKFEQNVFNNSKYYLASISVIIFIMVYHYFATLCNNQKKQIDKSVCITVLPVANIILVSYIFLQCILMTILLLTIKCRYQQLSKLLVGVKLRGLNNTRQRENIIENFKKVELLAFHLHTIVYSFKNLFNIQFFSACCQCLSILPYNLYVYYEKFWNYPAWHGMANFLLGKYKLIYDY